MTVLDLLDTPQGGVPDDPGEAPPVVELRAAERQFPGEPPVHALYPADLQVRAGEYLSVVGPSGSGKSTLLNLLGLLDRPSDGEYLLDGIPTARAGERDRAALRARHIGFVFQAFHLLPHRTVLENVLLATIYSGVPRAERRDRAVAALDRVGLSHRLDFRPTVLSGGERQRTAVARAVVSQPRVLLADEPTGNLDSESSSAVLELFDELHAGGLTLLVITHEDDVSSRAQRRVRITDGHLREIA
ncbi:ABC transporter ATP-binding protein [Cellulomonas avistercoris]|uniref:ABC transporter ATP-binding protein n=1 Tax=Cellulomonas avistercoris TaxID=2762242 RepID=UPI00296B2131|nr:ABC transporter ATP-binding protein [Cellulomonas avistercoris]